MSNKKIQIIDMTTGEIEGEGEFNGEYAVQYTGGASGAIQRLGSIHNAHFGEKHEIKNWYYAPIAERLVEKFEELEHIGVGVILFIEDVEWTKPKGVSSKKPWIARMKKANEMLENIWGYRYVMETRGYFTEDMSREQIIAMIYHELLHIGYEGELKPHDIEDWGSMVATLGANWATTQGEILDLLDDEFPGWDELRRAGQQTSLFEVTPMPRANAATATGI